MKLWTTCVLLGAMIALTGCEKERIPPDDAYTWETIAADKGTSVTSIEKQKETIEPEAAAADGVAAILKGSDFRIDGTTDTKNISGDVFKASHYFAASAPVEFKTSVTVMETEIEGENRDGAVPLIGFKIVSTSGKYRSFSAADRPIDGKQTLEDQYEIGPGTYNVTMTYYKDTVGQKRPTVKLSRITFRE